jgi:polyphosphate kinase
LPWPPLTKKGKIARKFYDKELRRLQEELVKLQYWVKHNNLRVVVLFEGRDAAGKGGAIKRITERTSPRIVRVVAWARPMTAKKPNGGFSAMWPIYRPAVKSFCLTAVGTTAPW